MKQFAAVVALSFLGVLPFRAAPPTTATSAEQLAVLVQEIQVQNAQMAQNQTAIEAKLATLAESVRVARIYATRGQR